MENPVDDIDYFNSKVSSQSDDQDEENTASQDSSMSENAENPKKKRKTNDAANPFIKEAQSLTTDWKSDYGKLVWSKDGTFPWWPARVMDPEELPPHIQSIMEKKKCLGKKHCVLNYGSHDYGFVVPSKVVDYAEFQEQYKAQKIPKSYAAAFPIAVKGIEADMHGIEIDASDSIGVKKRVRKVTNRAQVSECTPSNKSNNTAVQPITESNLDEDESINSEPSSSEVQDIKDESSEDSVAISKLPKKRGRKPGSKISKAVGGGVEKIQIVKRKESSAKIADRSKTSAKISSTDGIKPLVRDLKRFTGMKSYDKAEATRILEELRALRPTLDDIISCDAHNLIKSLRKFNDPDIVALANSVKDAWKKYLESQDDKMQRQNIVQTTKPVTTATSSNNGGIPLSSSFLSTVTGKSDNMQNTDILSLKQIEIREAISNDSLPVDISPIRKRAMHVFHKSIGKKLQSTIEFESYLFKHCQSLDNNDYRKIVTKISFLLKDESLSKLKNAMLSEGFDYDLIFARGITLESLSQVQV